MDYTSSQKSFPCQYAIQNHAKGCQTILASTKHYFFGSVCFYTEWFYTEWLNKLYWSSFSACFRLPQTIISTFNSIYSNALIDWAKRIAHLPISIYIYNLGSVIFFFWGGGGYSIQFKFICIALFTLQIVAKQLYRKLSFYNIFININLFCIFRILKRYHSFHNNMKQHNCFSIDNKKCLLSSKSAYWSNDAGNSALHHRNKLHFNIY